MRSIPKRLLAWSGAAVLTGCSAIATFDGFVGTPEANVVADAGEGGSAQNDGAVGASSDGSSSQMDSTTPDNDGSAGGPAFCVSGAKNVLLCEDFEAAVLDPNVWQSPPNTKGSGTVGLSKDTAVSGTSSLKSNAKQHVGGEYYQDIESVDFLQSASAFSTATFRVEVAFNLSMDLVYTSDTGVNATLLDIATDNGGELWIWFDKSSMHAGFSTWTLGDGGGETDYDSDLGMAPPLNGWHTLLIDVTFGDSNGFTVSIDGKMVGGGSGLRGVTSKASLVHLYLGLDDNGHFGDTKAYFDNARITALAVPIP